MMKKRTVIITEKREVWVVRQPSIETKEEETKGSEVESAHSPITPPDQYSETAVSPDEQQDERQDEAEGRPLRRAQKTPQ